MPRKKSDAEETILRLCNMTRDAWLKRREDLRKMQPAQFMLERLMSVLTEEDLGILMRAWAKDREDRQRIVVVPANVLS